VLDRPGDGVHRGLPLGGLAAFDRLPAACGVDQTGKLEAGVPGGGLPDLVKGLPGHVLLGGAAVEGGGLARGVAGVLGVEAAGLERGPDLLAAGGVGLDLLRGEALDLEVDAVFGVVELVAGTAQALRELGFVDDVGLRAEFVELVVGQAAPLLTVLVVDGGDDDVVVVELGLVGAVGLVCERWSGSALK